MKTSLLIAITLLCFFSCTKTDAPQEPPTKAQAIALSASEQAILSENQSFSVDLFKTICQDPKQTGKNVFISPYSVAVALGMLYNGAAGETKEEIAAVLGMEGQSPEQINSYYQKLTKALLEVDPTTRLSIANAIWLSKSAVFKPDFIQLNKDYYNAQAASLDFLQATAALKTINDWCNTQTKGLIPTILNEIDPTTLAILMNAVYFKGIWQVPFDKKNTAKQGFKNADGSVNQIDMMHTTETFPYTQQDKFAMLTIPYGNDAFRMEVLLPNQGINAEQVLAAITPQSLKTWREQSTGRKIALTLPKFTLRNELKLPSILSQMGMPSAFDSNRANLSALSDYESYVSDVIHKTFVELNEEGTTAAAVTAITIIKTSIEPGPTPFIVDRPFIFTISEKSTGTILFIGTVQHF